jgi:hypothetical protein
VDEAGPKKRNPTREAGRFVEFKLGKESGSQTSRLGLSLRLQKERPTS